MEPSKRSERPRSEQQAKSFIFASHASESDEGNFFETVSSGRTSGDVSGSAGFSMYARAL